MALEITLYFTQMFFFLAQENFVFLKHPSFCEIFINSSLECIF